MTPSHKMRICPALSIVLAAAIGPLSANPAPSSGTATPVAYGMQTGGSQPAVIRSTAISTNTPATTPVRYTGWSLLRSDDKLPAESPLVIPAREIDVAAANQISEDLSIMGRIIEKSVLASYGVRPPEWSDVFVGGHAGQGLGPAVLFGVPGRTKPLYVGGYGATFFIQVDFPLLPPPEKAGQEQAQPEEDAVWAQTKRSLLDPRTAGVAPRAEPAGQPYSQGKVESFRRSLIATMKHGANIRALESGEWLVFVVQGPGSPVTDAALPILGTVLPGRSVMTLRATKADVDACAKGPLSQEQFEQRVQAITY